MGTEADWQDTAHRGQENLSAAATALHHGVSSTFTNDEIDYFQNNIDDMWEKWRIPGVILSCKMSRPTPVHLISSELAERFIDAAHGGGQSRS